jgi:hypothetical protein
MNVSIVTAEAIKTLYAMYGKFKVIRIDASENYAHRWINKLYNY